MSRARKSKDAGGRYVVGERTTVSLSAAIAYAAALSHREARVTHPATAEAINDFTSMRGKNKQPTRHQPRRESFKKVAPFLCGEVSEKRTDPNDVELSTDLHSARVHVGIDGPRAEHAGAKIHAVMVEVARGESCVRESRTEVAKRAPVAAWEVEDMRGISLSGGSHGEADALEGHLAPPKIEFGIGPIRRVVFADHIADVCDRLLDQIEWRQCARRGPAIGDGGVTRAPGECVEGLVMFRG